MIKIVTIVGARPQFIKAAALSRVIREEFSQQVNEVILHTGQHYDKSMSELFFRELQIPEPAYNLDIGSLSHGDQTGLMIQGIERSVLREKPDGIIVYGDTNSTLAGALAAAKLHIPVIHIEAGLRSFNKNMPEEINRITCDHVSTMLFSPTLSGVKNLEREGIVHSGPGPYSFDRQGVFHSGDLMYDNTLFFREVAARESNILAEMKLEGQPYILATVHRPSNTDIPGNLLNIIKALGKISSGKKIPVILPLHPRTAQILDRMKSTERGILDDPSGLIRFIPAVSFLDMINLEAGASVILTDSGGVQKEAWFMEKPVVVLRDETEWVEIIEAGNGRLAGADAGRIVDTTFDFLEDPPRSFPPIFGNGQAAREILEILTSTRWS